MTDIKRYDIIAQFGCTYMKETPNGEWIKASDHDKAMSEKDKRTAELEQQLKGRELQDRGE